MSSTNTAPAAHLRIKDIKKYESNPSTKKSVFTIRTRVKKVKVKKGEYDLVHKETGAVQTGVDVIEREYVVDETKFLKLFAENIGALCELKYEGMKVFWYISKILPKDSDSFVLVLPDLLKFCKYKHNEQAYRGIIELVEAGIIYKSTEKNVWFIDPKLIFNGDRIKFIKSIRLEEAEEIERLKIEAEAVLAAEVEAKRKLRKEKREKAIKEKELENKEPEKIVEKIKHYKEYTSPVIFGADTMIDLIVENKNETA